MLRHIGIFDVRTGIQINDSGKEISVSLMTLEISPCLYKKIVFKRTYGNVEKHENFLFFLTETRSFENVCLVETGF